MKQQEEDDDDDEERRWSLSSAFCWRQAQTFVYTMFTWVHSVQRIHITTLTIRTESDEKNKNHVEVKIQFPSQSENSFFLSFFFTIIEVIFRFSSFFSLPSVLLVFFSFFLNDSPSFYLSTSNSPEDFNLSHTFLSLKAWKFSSLT